MSDIEVQQVDINLLQFKTYDEYLDSLVTARDLFYLESPETARHLAQLGFLPGGEVLDEDAFYRRRQYVHDLLMPAQIIGILASGSTQPKTQLQRHLAARELANRAGSLSTIIFVRPTGGATWAFIDYAHRLVTEDWVSFFRGKKRLVAHPNDLCFREDWLTGKIRITPSPNYEPFFDRSNQLAFLNLHDGKTLRFHSETEGVVRKERLQVEGFDRVILFDYEPKGKSELLR